jgi:hypothetical protein
LLSQFPLLHPKEEGICEQSGYIQNFLKQLGDVMNTAKNLDKPHSWWKKWFHNPFPPKSRVKTIVFQGLLHARTVNTLLFPYSDCRIDHEELQITKLNARLYRNFLIVDGQFLIKSFFLAQDDLLRLEHMVSDFLTTQELPGLLPEMKIEFGEITTDYYYTPSAKATDQTAFHNEVVIEIPYFIIQQNDL